ncbi:amidohydrolase family protein [Isoptericola sp. NPDC056618]|uniref:amidohydrolase family protein n=1 Tax=Isoptericola sp. NPDC056618 TaxID=3345878 RepID=UPI0036B0E7A3
MIIDVHGHYTTAPEPLAAWREAQVAALDGGPAPDPAGPRISDDQIRETLEANQLAQMDARGIDVTVFSPRASFMAHHVGDLATSAVWARICNDLCARVADLYPQRFMPAAMLPQSPGVDPATVVGELERAVTELGAVAVNLNPDPSGGHWTAPPLTDRSWYPVYEKLVELDVPAMVHVSTSCNPAFHTTGAHYLNADTTAFMQLLQGDLFTDLPELRLVIPHGGGAVPYHWGRFRGLAQALGRPEPEEMLGTNVFFDTCVYHQPGVDLLLDVIPHEGVLFASEMVGAVRGIDPRTGHHFDDTRRYVQTHAEARSLGGAQVRALFDGNARRVYPRLDKRLADQGR